MPSSPAAAAAGAAAGGGRTASGRPSVDVTDLRALLDAGGLDGSQGLLLDVRDAGEREIVTIPGAVWLTMDDLRAGAEVPVPAGTRVYVHCKTGSRSAEAVDLLRARGVDAVDVEGGVLAWIRDVDPDLPTY